MLIRFTTKNFRSFKDDAQLSLVPGKYQGLQEHIVEAQHKKDIPVLTAALIFGPNASGKSNLIHAMSEAQRLIRFGVRSGQRIPNFGFKLDPLSISSPTVFTFEIKVKNKNYEYGFSTAKGVVVKEWLLKVTKNTDEIVFERNRDKHDGYNFNLGSDSLKNDGPDAEQFLSFVTRSTPDNKLFLLECKDRNLNETLPSLSFIEDIHDWFDEDLIIIFPDSMYGGLELQLQSNKEFEKPFTALLQFFDTGIDGILFEEVELGRALSGFSSRDKDEIIDSIGLSENLMVAKSPTGNDRYLLRSDTEGTISAFKLMTKHVDNRGEHVPFDISDESDGTQRMMYIIPGMLSVLGHRKTLIVDEIDRSLHPDITRLFISSFLRFSEKTTSQLIVTTHDYDLMDLDLVRKDEIWFTQKSSVGESELYSLQEFKNVRRDTNIRTAYQDGRYGAKPITSEITKRVIN